MRYAKGLEETDTWQEVIGGIGAEELGGGGEKGSDSGRGGDAEVGGEEAVEAWPIADPMTIIASHFLMIADVAINHRHRPAWTSASLPLQRSLSDRSSIVCSTRICQTAACRAMHAMAWKPLTKLIRLRQDGGPCGLGGAERAAGAAASGGVEATAGEGTGKNMIRTQENLALSRHSLALHLALLSDIHLLASSGILSMCPPSLQCIGGTFLSSTLHTPLFVLFPSPYPSPFLPYHPLSLLFTSHFPNLSLTLPYPFPPPFLPFPTPFPPVLPPSPPLAFLLPSQARRGGSVAELQSTTPM
ncbi:unnamed protein product [Closterium sp. NIES-65]|nr:unnamed protein product [Closterium sp. NIES-65]